MVEVAINNSVHALTQHTPFFMNGLLHPRLPTLLECDSWIKEGGTSSSKNGSGSCSSRVDAYVVTYDAGAERFPLAREAVLRFVQDSIAHAVDRQTRNADKDGRANVISLSEGDLVLLSTVNLPRHAVTNVGSSKLLPKNIVPFRVLRRVGNSYTIELPRTMRAHPTFYVRMASPPVLSLRSLFRR